jgi:transcription elongation factor GreA
MDVDATVLISAAGYDRLSREIEMLRTEARRALTEQLREAREDGDLDDNPVLGDLLEEQVQLEQRISVLEARVLSAEIVRDLAAGSTHEYELVGPLESDVGSGRVSVEAPVGRALVGGRPGDRLDVETPRGVLGLEVVDVGPASEASLEREAA